MPIVNGKYQAPTWVNGNRPAINASELQAICDTLEGIPSNYYTQEQTLNSVVKALFGQGSGATPNAIFQILANAALYQNGEIVTPGGITVPNLKVELGSYVGTGATGESNPNSLTLSFSPSLLIIYGESCIFLFSNNDENNNGQTIMSAGTSSFGRQDVPVTCNENVVNWYYRTSDSFAVFAQMNFKNSVYQYIAFSK